MKRRIGAQQEIDAPDAHQIPILRKIFFGLLLHEVEEIRPAPTRIRDQVCDCDKRIEPSAELVKEEV
jgi:hypothetical protein